MMTCVLVLKEKGKKYLLTRQMTFKHTFNPKLMTQKEAEERCGYLRLFGFDVEWVDIHNDLNEIKAIY